MAPFYLVLAVIIQSSFIHADIDVSENNETSREVLQKPAVDDDEISQDDQQKEWFNMFMMPENMNMYQSPSAMMMSQITNSNKTLEEQLKDIKEIARQISIGIEDELIRLCSYAMANNEVEENGKRKRRSVETPMDSTEMVMRLLRHIKSNNEYQNIAIDKMMSAKEIAEKFGIEFNPDPEILSDLAMAANEHAQEMTTMLQNACDLKNTTQVEFVPAVEEGAKKNATYYTYSVHPEEKVDELNDLPPYEYLPEVLSKPAVNHIHYNANPIPYTGFPYETQLTSPPVHHHSPPVTPKPTFYDFYEPFTYPFSPASDMYSPYHPVDPLVSTILLPFEEPMLEPELVGEEVEETVTSKMLVEQGDEPGSSVVNHVTSYTISEKSHFKSPQIEKLPQQFQYCFFLI